MHEATFQEDQVGQQEAVGADDLGVGAASRELLDELAGERRLPDRHGTRERHQRGCVRT